MEWKDRYDKASWMAYLDPTNQNRLDKPSAADAFQVRSVSTTGFIRRIGNLSEADLSAAAKAIALEIEYPVFCCRHLGGCFLPCSEPMLIMR